MDKIPFHIIDQNSLSPMEMFLFEKYRLNLETIESEEDFSESLHALAMQYPETVQGFLNICKHVLNGNYPETEDRYMEDDINIAINGNMRYFLKKDHVHQFFEVGIVLEGQCEIIVNQVPISLKKGDVCFLAPDIPHRYLITSHTTVAYNLMVRSSTFQNTFVTIFGKNDIVSDFFTTNLYRRTKDTSPYILCKTDSEPVYKDLLMQMIQEFRSPGKYSQRYLHCLFELLILELLRLHEYHFTIGDGTDNIETESITAILRYMQGNYKTLTLTDAARFFNYSEAHLSRLVKKFTGQNFTGIIKTIKLQKAAHLLLESNKSISEIVEEIGYTDHSHFYKIFKAHYEMTPIQYKELNASESPDIR